MVAPAAYVSHKLAIVGVDVWPGKRAIVNAHVTVVHDTALGGFTHSGVGAQAWLQAGCYAGCQVAALDRVVLAPVKALIAKWM